MTIDVEDYFHVSVFDGLVPRHAWDGLESRVCANTERLLEIFDESGMQRDVLRARLGGRAASRRSCARSPREGHEIASHGYAHRLVYDLTPAAVPRGHPALEGRARRRPSAHRCIGYRAPSYSVTPRSLWALDVLIEEGFRYDASIFPIHHDRYGIPISPRHPYLLQRGAARWSKRRRRRSAGARSICPIGGGGYFRILPYAWTRWGIARLNRRRAAAGHLLPASVGNRSGSAAAARVGCSAGSATTAIWARPKSGCARCSRTSTSRP